MGPLPPGLGQRPFPSPPADAETPGFPRLPGRAGAPCSPPVWVPLGRGRAGRGGGAGPLLGSQAPAPGTIETPSRTPLPGRPGQSADWEGEQPGRVPLCPTLGIGLSRTGAGLRRLGSPPPSRYDAAPVPQGRGMSRGPASYPPQCPWLICQSPPHSRPADPQTRTHRSEAQGLWALFLNPLVGIPGLWGSWRDFRAGPEGGRAVI